MTHQIDPDVIREMHEKWHHRPNAIAYILNRPENDIRKVLGLPPLPAHRIRPWQPVSMVAREMRGRKPGPPRQDRVS